MQAISVSDDLRLTESDRFVADWIIEGYRKLDEERARLSLPPQVLLWAEGTETRERKSQSREPGCDDE